MGNVDDFLKEARSGRFPAAKFETIGATVMGTITGLPKVVTNQFGTSLVIDLMQEDGTGVTVWVKEDSNMARKVSEAVGDHGLAEGGKLAIQFTEEMDTGKGNPAKLFRCEYEPPVAKVDVASIFGNK